MAFINFYTTLNEAVSSIESPITTHFMFKGIQLMPGSTNPYTQFTETSTGVELEDWEVFAVNLITSERTDISDKFSVFGNFTDSKGMPQIMWTLTDLPDFGNSYIYLEVNQSFGATYYTNPFEITAKGAELTARYDYRNKLTDYWQSIQIVTWYRQDLNRDEISSYYQISTNNTVSPTIKKSLIQKWFTGIVSNNMMVKYRELFITTYVYVDLQRFYLFEAFEIPELSQRQNFAQQDYLITLDKNDLLIENINDMGVLDDIALIKAILKPVTDGGVIWIWDKPASEIPAGYAEETNIAGKTIMGRLEGDPVFGVLGSSSGSLTATLSESNLPDHSHRMFVNSSVDISENELNDFPDRFPTYRGFGEGSADRDYAIAGSETSPTLGLTGVGSGESEAFSILNPNRVVNFIKWVGLP